MRALRVIFSMRPRCTIRKALIALSGGSTAPDGARRAGNIRLCDRGGIDGEGLGAPAVLGTCRAWATLLALGPLDRLPDAALLESLAAAADCLCGAGAAPNGLGLAARLAGPDGGTLGRCLEQLGAVCAGTLLGFTPVRRRK